MNLGLDWVFAGTGSTGRRGPTVGPVVSDSGASQNKPHLGSLREALIKFAGDAQLTAENAVAAVERQRGRARA
jgi:hypothetical protein